MFPIGKVGFAVNIEGELDEDTLSSHSSDPLESLIKEALEPLIGVKMAGLNLKRIHVKNVSVGAGKAYSDTLEDS
jgi:hypothetical protein